MDYGTAANKLRRLVQWSLLVDLGRTACFRCRFEMDAESYSLDHIERWLDEETSRFWDLNNIAWSHRVCNTQARRIVGGARIHARPGFVWCGGHKDFAPEADFSKSSARWTGYHNFCKACRATYDKRPRGQINARSGA